MNTRHQMTNMGAKQKRKTPSKSAENEDLDMTSFSPVQLESPSYRQQQGNLTGSARKLKDGAADLHNYMQKWGSLNVEGVNIVNEIANLKLEKILGKNEDKPDTELLPESLLPLCDKLEKLLKKMEKVVSRLCGLMEMSKGVAELEKFKQQDASSDVLFQTWDVDRFSMVFREVSEMYQKEMQLKHVISENICHAEDRNTIMFYSAAWLHQPYIDTNCEVLLESLLLETAHKT